jgi:hypothetical protein
MCSFAATKYSSKKSSSAPLPLATMDDIPWHALEQLVQSFSTNASILATPDGNSRYFCETLSSYKHRRLHNNWRQRLSLIEQAD